MYRTAVGNLHQTLFLLIIKRAVDLYFAINLIQLSIFGLTGLTIRSIDFLMIQLNGDPIQRPLLAIRIHAQRHRGAGPQSGHQKIIRGRAQTGPAHRDGFIGDHTMTFCHNVGNISGFSNLGDHLVLGLRISLRFIFLGCANIFQRPGRNDSAGIQ